MVSSCAARARETLATLRLGMPPRLCVRPRRGLRPGARPRGRAAACRSRTPCAVRTRRRDVRNTSGRRRSGTGSRRRDRSGHRARRARRARGRRSPRSSISTSSVMEKQSCTSIRSSCSRGSSMPASRYARCAARRVVSVWLPSQLAWPISTPFDGASCSALIVTMSRLTERRGDRRRRDDRAGRAVADAAAIVQAERIGDHRWRRAPARS